uniref:Uncharacterized protein n=1 Tax=Arundo donax TaxID=35708 RepID=A0A0A9CQZ6_ARUDO
MGFLFLKLLLLPGEVPDPPRHVLQPRVLLLRAPHRVRPEPGLVEVGLVVPGDYLLDEVPGGGEVPPLAEEERGPVPAPASAHGGGGALAGIEDGVEVAVDPVVVAVHRRRDRGEWARRGRGGEWWWW